MIKNIFNLTRIFFKDSFQNPYMIDKKTNKINIKSIFVWLIIIITIVISFFSYKAIDIANVFNKPTIFLNTLFLIVNLIMIFQVILASINIYMNSKDIEFILPLPIKAEEVLIAKFNTILINMYFTELIFAFFPLIIYGIRLNLSIIYYFYVLIFLFIFPILTILIISTIMMLIVKMFRFVKNKDILQVIIAGIFIFIVLVAQFKITTNLMSRTDENMTLDDEIVIQAVNNFDIKLEKINKYFLVINPMVKVLNNTNQINCILEILKVIFINLIFFLIFIFIGKKYYLKNILKNTNYKYYKKIKIEKLEKKLKKSSTAKAYIKKEIITLFKNPVFFVQCIFPVLILMISITIIVGVALPNLQEIKESELFGSNNDFITDIRFVCLILGLIQLLFTMSNISINAISREGKSAIYMKSFPIDLYKQFKYKTIPQTLINTILIIIILAGIKLIFPIIDYYVILLLFIESSLLNIINSVLMVLVDLYRPNINWKEEYQATKTNNRLFQYGLTIMTILFLSYLGKVLLEINLYLANIIMIIILIIIVSFIKILIRLNINKLYKKIK